MLLGNSSWRIRRVEGKSGRVIVEDANGAPPTIPFWLGEAPARTEELSLHVADFRRQMSEMLPNTSPIGLSQSQPEVAAAVAWLKEECGLDDSSAEQAIQYVLEGRAVLEEGLHAEKSCSHRVVFAGFAERLVASGDGLYLRLRN